MSNDKALAIVPRTIDEVTSLAEVLAKSTLMPDALRNKVPDVVVSILAGQELGLSPMAAIRGVHVVQGKPVLSADTMVALVLSSGLAEYFSCIEDTAERVTYETKRKGSPIAQKLSWSTEDTKRAGLNTKDNWRFYTRAMMKARAKAALARDVYPDVLAGCYDEDEAATPARAPQHADIEDAEVISETSPLAQALAAIEAAGSVAEMKSATVATITALKLQGTDKTVANDAYKAKIAALRELEAQPVPQTAPAVEPEPATEPAS